MSEEKSKLEIVSDVDAEPDIRRAIEAILMIAIDPVPPSILAQLFEVKVSEIERICDSMVDQYSEAELGFSLVRIAGGYRFQSKPEQAQWVERFVLEGQSRRLTAAAGDEESATTRSNRRGLQRHRTGKRSALRNHTRIS